MIRFEDKDNRSEKQTKEVNFSETYHKKNYEN
jgi:hypothetical protein